MLTETDFRRAQAALRDGKKVDVFFRAVTRWSGGELNRRRLQGIAINNRLCVRFGGWSDFALMPGEIERLEFLD